jgi:hypothetical protein
MMKSLALVVVMLAGSGEADCTAPLSNTTLVPEVWQLETANASIVL